jgi:hypothetical protein
MRSTIIRNSDVAHASPAQHGVDSSHSHAPDNVSPRGGAGVSLAQHGPTLDDAAWSAELDAMRPLFADYDARGAWGFFS